MPAKMEYSGSDVADAIKTACQKLNVAQEQLDIEIVSTGSAGIFGLGRRKAKILVALKDASDDEATTAQPARPAREPKPARREKPAPAADAPPRREPAKPLSAEAVTAIQNDLLRLLELMELPATIEAEQKDGKLRIHVNGGEHIEQIIGPAGQTLDSIQYLLRKMAGKKMTERVQITLDAGDFREARVSELEETATRLADEVKETGRTKSIPSLNPAERRVVHMLLQNDTAIRSRSVGDGLYKKVLIYLPGKGRKRTGKGPRKPRQNEQEQ